jgi:hypothetical protein
VPDLAEPRPRTLAIGVRMEEEVFCMIPLLRKTSRRAR